MNLRDWVEIRPSHGDSSFIYNSSFSFRADEKSVGPNFLYLAHVWIDTYNIILELLAYILEHNPAFKGSVYPSTATLSHSAWTYRGRLASSERRLCSVFSRTTTILSCFDI